MRRPTLAWLINRGALAIGATGFLQRRSTAFWQDAEDWHRSTDSGYYERRNAIIERMLATLPRASSAIDIGCGDGEFTQILARYADHVDGFDSNARWIRKARADAAAAGVTNVSFAVDLAESRDLGKRNLVTCIAVTSCIVDDANYFGLLDHLGNAVAPGGHLLMADTLVDGPGGVRVWKNGYLGHYRNATRYIEDVTARGFRLTQQQVAWEWAPGRSVHVCLFERTKAMAPATDASRRSIG